MISEKLRPFGTTIFAEMTQLAEKRGAINLSQGFPDFEGPPGIVEAAIGALRSGDNQYARSRGHPKLVRAISESRRRLTGLAYDPLAEVLVFSGATEGIASSLLGLLDPGDEVILLEPFYDCYPACVAMAGAVPRFLTLRFPEYALDVDALGNLVTERTRLIVLPEMFATGFSMRSEEVSEHAEGTCLFLDELARRLGVFVLAGFAEPGEPRPRNACRLTDPAGEEVLRYRKIHPFSLAGEDRHYTGGERLLTTDVCGVRVTPLICYDLRFPEVFRAAADGTDLFVVIANWPEKRRDAWTTLLGARAIENQAFVLGVNRVGAGGGEPHSGDSAHLDPFGVLRAGAAREPAVLLSEVDPEEVRDARARFGFLADRRPDVYDRY